MNPLKTYLKNFSVASIEYESRYLALQRQTFVSYYPFGVFEARDFDEFEFEPITIFSGANGSGKSTLLNVIAESLGVKRLGPFNTSKYMSAYTEGCNYVADELPKASKIITSDDVFNYLTDVRYMNIGIQSDAFDLFEEYYDNRHKSLEIPASDNYKKHIEAITKGTMQFINGRLINSAVMESNGQSSIRFFTSQITENALYLLDEPENSLSTKMQLELKKYIEDSVKGYNCQFIISTHSPFFLALDNAKIYNLDDYYGVETRWTELESVRTYYDFFKKYKSEFEDL